MIVAASNLLIVALILINLALALYYRKLNMYLTGRLGISVLTPKVKVIIDGIFIIELVYLVYVITSISPQAENNNVIFLNVFSQVIKSLYFLVTLLWMITDLKKEINKLKLIIGNKNNGHRC